MKSKESGQTLVVILLVVATSLLVGAGVATRSTSLIQQTTFSEESTQALHFAEGCAEEALGMIKDETITRDVRDNPVGYCCDVEGSGGCAEKADLTDDCADEADCEFTVNSYEDLFVGIVDQDDTVEIKLDEMDTDTCDALGLYWCMTSENCNDVYEDPHGLEVSVIYEDGGEYKVWKEVYGDEYAHDFTLPDSGGTFGGEEFDYSKTISFSDLPSGTLKAVRLTPRFEGFHIKVNEDPNGTGCDYGFQGYDIYTGGWFGRSTRKVRVTRGEPAMPPIFDYSIFSGSETEPLEKD